MSSNFTNGCGTKLDYHLAKSTFAFTKVIKVLISKSMRFDKPKMEVIHEQLRETSMDKSGQHAGAVYENFN